MSINLIKQQFLQNKESWRQSFLSGFCQDENGSALPWMSYNFIEFLKKNLTKNATVFEFGSGSSTIFFANRVKKIITLETCRKWFKIMQEKCHDFNNIELILM